MIKVTNALFAYMVKYHPDLNHFPVLDTTQVACNWNLSDFIIDGQNDGLSTSIIMKEAILYQLGMVGNKPNIVHYVVINFSISASTKQAAALWSFVGKHTDGLTAVGSHP